MKKIISLALATSMVAGMAVTAFARPTEPNVDPTVSPESPLYVGTEMKGFSEWDQKEIRVDDETVIAIKLDELPYDFKESDMRKYKAFFQVNVGERLVVEDGVKLGYHKYEKTDRTPTRVSHYEIDSKKARKVGGYSSQVYAINARIPNEIINTIYSWAPNYKKDSRVELRVLANKGVVGLDSNGLIAVNYNPADLMSDGELNYVIIDNKTGEETYVTNANLINANNTQVRDMTVWAEDQVKAAFKAVTVGGSKAPMSYDWFITINLKEATANLDVRGDLFGKVTIAKTAQQAKDNFDIPELCREIDYIRYSNEYGHDWRETHQEVEDFQFEKAGQQAMFIVDTTGIRSFDGCFSTTMDEKVWEKYAEPDYELFFYSWPHAPKFNRTGSLFFYSDDTSFKGFHVYEIDEDHNLTEVPATWNEEEGTLEIRTRVLKNYVISENELGIEEEPTEAPAEAPAEAPSEKPADKDNPGTGR